ncbi:MAG: hypothetical protein NTY15_01680 [Planctomycetota bacterium]|nr:hypothetical protein [Planctomycetota bacterium]
MGAKQYSYAILLHRGNWVNTMIATLLVVLTTRSWVLPDIELIK